MRRLYVLRPEPGASDTVERAAALGLDARSIPLFRIESIDWSPPDLDMFDGILLTSANAVRQGGDSLDRLTPLPAYAVGEATAAAAHHAGFGLLATGEGGVRSLLDAIPGRQRLLHLCGEHHTRVDLAPHQVTRIPVYRSSPAAVAGDRLREILGQVATVHSPRAAERLSELVGRRDRSSIRLAAISKAAAEAAGPGWRKVEWPVYPRDSALLALGARLCEDDDEE
jgi:uroporphyrinogen-III synthase